MKMFKINGVIKMKEKIIRILLVIAIAIIFYSCADNPAQSSMTDAVITGFDLRACACCGGLMINFNGDTASYKGEFYIISNNPAEFGITDISDFPIFVKVDWQKDTSACINNRIIITKFVKK